jgi:GTP-binding protein Era
VKSGLIALAGRPNVGKSTIVNALCGEKIAIVSDKPQTTRRRISGVWSDGEHQLVLVDLPGFQRPRDAMTARMQKTVDGSFEEIDAIVFVVAADEPVGGGDEFVARRVFATGTPVVIVVNKTDRVRASKIAQQIDRVAKLGDFHALHPVSAKLGEGIEPLRDELVRLLPEGPALFPPDVVTDQTLDERVSELLREQALHVTRQEIPHAVGVQIIEADERRIRAVILVETESQKRIVVGAGGSVIKEIGSKARHEIEKLLGRSVYLDVRVKVREGWRQDPEQLRRLGI